MNDSPMTQSEFTAHNELFQKHLCEVDELIKRFEATLKRLGNLDPQQTEPLNKTSEIPKEPTHLEKLSLLNSRLNGHINNLGYFISNLERMVK